MPETRVLSVEQATKGLSKFSSSTPQKEGRVMNIETQDGSANRVPTAPHPTARGWLWLIVAFLACGAMNLSWGQGTAYITGFVTDPTQAAVAGASVVVKSDDTGTVYDVKTTETGVYRSPALPPGKYSVNVTAAGFQDSVVTGVEVLLGQSRTLDIALKIGAVSETVRVEAVAALLKTEDPGLGENVQYSAGLESAVLQSFGWRAAGPCPHRTLHGRRC